MGAALNRLPFSPYHFTPPSSTYSQYPLDNELATFVDDPSVFPPISMEWDYPSAITNAVINIRKQLHGFNCLFDSLGTLHCQHIQIRAYAALT
ncbi:hypothetical protein KTO58_01915 [Chitinophaga pendula]|uniref:hypothetical protein n=1 Tax=Chitinophaga TaxID=79328 RepID=UPI0012FE71DB|nr:MULTISPECIES: hypothetical protein [Chitinophaga]UCJ07958.1 hypothetical protein KTO58_01915 [Chitinophaga pendula]